MPAPVTRRCPGCGRLLRGRRRCLACQVDHDATPSPEELEFLPTDELDLQLRYQEFSRYVEVRVARSLGIPAEVFEGGAFQSYLDPRKN